MPKEVAQLDILTSFMNKRLSSFKDKYANPNGVKSLKKDDIKLAQHKLIRELIVQVAI